MHVFYSRKSQKEAKEAQEEPGQRETIGEAQRGEANTQTNLKSKVMIRGLKDLTQETSSTFMALK